MSNNPPCFFLFFTENYTLFPVFSGIMEKEDVVVLGGITFFDRKDILQIVGDYDILQIKETPTPKVDAPEVKFKCPYGHRLTCQHTG